MIAGLLDRLRQGDRNSLARLLSFAARGENLPEIQLDLARHPAELTARVVAFTGSGGVGKSSLVGKMISVVRDARLKVAVLACDPESPLSGGALLGDRFRMGSPTDDAVFIRSLAAHTGHGALAGHLDVMIQLLEAYGFNVVFLETVGSGQGDVEVRKFADVVVLLLQPESGDDVQWEKAGILECADIVVVHKADLPAADQTAAQVRSALDLSPSNQAPVLRVSTKANQGHAELWRAIAALPLRRQRVSSAQMLVQFAIDSLQQRIRELEKKDDVALRKLIQDWERGEVTTPNAIRELTRLIS